VEQVIVMEMTPVMVRNGGEAQAGVRVEAGRLENTCADTTAGAGPHLGEGVAADLTVTLQDGTEVTVHHLHPGIQEEGLRAVGAATAGFKSEGHGGEDRERGVGVHSLLALISLGEGVFGEVHAGFYMQTTVMELLLVSCQAEEGADMDPGVVDPGRETIMMMVSGLGVVVGHLLGGQMRDPGQDEIGIQIHLKKERRTRTCQRRFWKIRKGINLRDLHQVTMVMIKVLN
jgi:hypothetical protein